MQFEYDALDKFLAIYKNEFGITLAGAEASEIVFRLWTLYELLLKMPPQSK